MIDYFKEITKILLETEDLELEISAHDIKRTSHLREDLGLDSLGIMTLFSELQYIYESIEEEDMANWNTIQDIANTLANRTSPIVNNKNETHASETNLFLNNSPVSKDDIEKIRSEITEALKNIPEGSNLVLSHNEPCKLLYSFLISLELNIIPIMVSCDLPTYQLDSIVQNIPHCSAYINGRIIGSKTSPQEIITTKRYGTLTSGTTGLPKILYYDLENARANARAHCKSLNIDKDLHIIQSLPLYHSFGAIAYILAWKEIEFELHLKNSFAGLNQIKHISSKEIFLYTSPVQFRFFLKEEALRTLPIRSISIGGGLIDQKSLTECKKIRSDIALFTTYGLSEAGPRVSTGEYRDQPLGYIGTPIKDVEVAIKKEDQSIASKGIGQLLIKTPYLAVNINSRELLNGYIQTRDTVSIDEQGNIYFLSREDDLINVGGISVYPRDIEQAVLMLEGITDALVIKSEESKYEESPNLFIETSLSIEEIKEYLRDKLTIHQMPKKFFVFTEFPRTSLQKVDRNKLTKQLKESLSAL